MTHRIGIGPNLRKSAFYDATIKEGVASFSVYNHMLIPGHFGNPDAEYDRLLNSVAMWDVAAQRQVQLQGADADKLVQYLTPRNLSSTRIGQGRYIPLCDYDGWLINDPVLLKLAEDCYWLSVADSDIHLWAAAIAHEKGWHVRITEPDVSPLAIQGPKAENVTAKLFGEPVRAMKYFGFIETELKGIPLVLARSGWSKQGGFELYLRDSTYGSTLWNIVKDAGSEFGIGPGAPNDTERLESGLLSYGADMRWQTHRANPFEMGLTSLVDIENGHEFIGRTALVKAQQQGIKRKRVGVFIDDHPEPPGHPVALLCDDEPVGFVHEFAFSKRLQKTIGVGLADIARQDELFIHLNEVRHHVRVTDIPFI